MAFLIFCRLNKDKRPEYNPNHTVFTAICRPRIGRICICFVVLEFSVMWLILAKIECLIAAKSLSDNIFVLHISHSQLQLNVYGCYVRIITYNGSQKFHYSFAFISTRHSHIVCVNNLPFVGLLKVSNVCLNSRLDSPPQLHSPFQRKRKFHFAIVIFGRF